MDIDTLIPPRRPPPAPPGLRPRGAARRLWRDIHGAYALRPDELVVFVNAVRIVDEIEQMRDTLVVTPNLMVRGGRGAVVPHPLLDEIRRHENVLMALLGYLQLAASDGTQGQTAGRALANTRWSRRRG